MDKPALVDLIDVKNYPLAQVGELTQDLSKLSQKGVKITPTAVIPKYVFENIALTTSLVTQLKKALQQINPHQQTHETLALVKRTIRHTQLPDKVIRSVINWYRQYPGFVKVTTANHATASIAYQNIQGETNLIDSILMVWSEHIHLDLKSQELQIFAEPILIQHQDQPQAAGIALTSTKHHRSQLEIHSVWGAYDSQHPEIKADKFKVDIRTGQVLERQLHPQYLLLERKSDGFTPKTIKHYQQTALSLTDGQATKLAHLIITAKRTLYADQVISWYLYQDQFYLTHTQPLDDHHQRQPLDKKHILLAGDSLQAGIVGGEIFRLTTTADVHLVKHGQVVVISKLTSAHYPIFQKVAAIVCDQGVSSPMMIKHIREHNIPTIINTKHATTYLKPGLQIIVNADTAQVLSRPAPLKTAPRPNHSATFTKLYIAAGDPKKAQKYISPEVDGVGVLRSEYTFASFREHPLHVIRSKKRTQLKNELHKTIKAFRSSRPNFPVIYRAQNLTSQELRLFDHAAGYEPLESNPYLGFRGGLKTIKTFEVFDFELEVLGEALAESTSPLSLMLPFVRTPIELRLIVNHMFEKHQLNQYPHFGIYLQLNTPENILQLDHYLLPQLQGICLNVKSLHALMHGIDPDNPDIYSLYPLDIELLQTMMKKISRHQHLKTMIHLYDYNLQLVELATELKFDAVVVKPEFAPRAKQQILEVEESRHV